MSSSKLLVSRQIQFQSLFRCDTILELDGLLRHTCSQSVSVTLHTERLTSKILSKKKDAWIRFDGLAINLYSQYQKKCWFGFWGANIVPIKSSVTASSQWKERHKQDIINSGWTLPSWISPLSHLIQTDKGSNGLVTSGVMWTVHACSKFILKYFVGDICTKQPHAGITVKFMTWPLWKHWVLISGKPCVRSRNIQHT